MARKNNVIGIELGVDVTDLKNGLTEANKRIKDTANEFKLSTSTMENWQKSVDGIRAKTKQLNDEFKLQELKLRAIQDEYDAVSQSQGENSESAKKLKRDLDNQQIAVNKLKITLDNYTDTLDKAEKGEIDLEEATLKNGRAIVKQKKIADDTAKAQDNLGDKVDDTSKAMKDAESSTSKLSDGFTVMKGAIAGLITDGINAFIGGIRDSIENSKELRKELGMLKATASTTGSDYANAEKNLIKVASITDDTGAATEGLNNLMSAGFDGKQLDEVTDALVGASIKWKDTLKFEGLSDSIQEIIGSEGKSISGSAVELFERMGVDIEVWKEKFQTLTTDEERQNMILETLAKGGLADVKKEYEEVNKDLIDNNEALLENQLAVAEVGKALVPLQTALTKLKTKGIEALTPAIEKVSETLLKLFKGDFQGVFTDLSKLFEKIKSKIIEGIPKIFQWIETNLPTIFQFLIDSVINKIEMFVELLPKIIEIMTNIVQKTIEYLPVIIQKLADSLIDMMPLFLEGSKKMFEGLLEALPVVIDSLVKILPDIIDTITKFLVDATPFIVESAITLFNSLITALPIVLKSLIKALPSIIQAIVKFLIESLPVLLDAAIQLYMALIDAIPDFLPQLIAAIPQLILTIQSELLKAAPQLLGTAVELFASIISAWATMLGDVPEMVEDFFDEVKKEFEAIDWKSLGKDILDGIIDGLTDVGGKIKKAAKDVGGKIKNGFQDFFGIDSPSKLMRDEVGEYIGEGVGVGIVGSTKKVLKDVGKFNNAIAGGINIGGNANGISGGNTTNQNVTFNQVINSTKEPTIKELSRYTSNLLDLNKMRGFGY